jgi:hypothetical protein
MKGPKRFQRIRLFDAPAKAVPTVDIGRLREGSGT